MSLGLSVLTIPPPTGWYVIVCRYLRGIPIVDGPALDGFPWATAVVEKEARRAGDGELESAEQLARDSITTEGE